MTYFKVTQLRDGYGTATPVTEEEVRALALVFRQSLGDVEDFMLSGSWRYELSPTLKLAVVAIAPAL